MRRSLGECRSVRDASRRAKSSTSAAPVASPHCRMRGRPWGRNTTGPRPRSVRRSGWTALRLPGMVFSNQLRQTRGCPRHVGSSRVPIQHMIPTVSMVDLVKNAASAAGRAAVAFVSGQPVRVSDEVRRARIDVCFDCPAYEDALGECQICGCYIGLKSWLSTEQCPSKKWPGDTGPQE